MNLNKNIPVIIREDDYALLKPFLGRSSVNVDEMSLSAELSRAIVVKKDAFPPHAIRISSEVKILDQESGTTSTFQIVMPNQANIKESKVSILSPQLARQ
jgi:regulator of nucleoside diphosphate kinase